MAETIDDLRARIDQIDTEVAHLLNERARLALAIGEAKKATGRAVYDPNREKAVIERVLAASQGPFPEKTLSFIYREIISACRSLEEPTRVAYLGPEATFSHAAALRRFGSASTFLPQTDVLDIFREVERGNAAYGIVPIENSIEGAVPTTLDSFSESDLVIVGEVYLEVSQNLLAKESDLGAVKVVYSHPQGIAQCRNWLRKNLPHARLDTVSSTAEAARMAANQPGVAAVGSLGAAEFYGLRVLAKSIEDIPNNVTRFFVIGRESAPVPAAPKTSLLATLKDEPGVLFRVLEPLAKRGVNMTKIESRPLKRRPWEYRFFIDVDGAPDAEPLSSAIAEMRSACMELRILGTYEKAVRPAPNGARV
jgi:chorismate mutase/prephenate dehydratase